MLKIDPQEVKYSYVWAMDDVGRVFFWQGRVFRGINEPAAEQVRDLFACGCLDELSAKGLFPKSTITDYTIESSVIGQGIARLHTPLS